MTPLSSQFLEKENQIQHHEARYYKMVINSQYYSRSKRTYRMVAARVDVIPMPTERPLYATMTGATIKHSNRQSTTWITHLTWSQCILSLTEIRVQIDPGTESSSRPGQDDDFNPIIKINGREESNESMNHATCNHVKLFRAIGVTIWKALTPPFESGEFEIRMGLSRIDVHL